MLDVVAMPRNKLRGQAWVVFRDIQASTQAMRALQGFDFFGNLMVVMALSKIQAVLISALQKIQYAKGKSHAIAKLDGTYRMTTATMTTTTSTDLQQQIFGAPPSSLPAPVKALPEPTANGKMETDVKEEAKGVKRGRDEESDEEVSMDEDSDAPMEEGSDDDD